MEGVDRLIVQHKVSIIQFLPASYKARMERIPGWRSPRMKPGSAAFYQEPKGVLYASARRAGGVPRDVS